MHLHHHPHPLALLLILYHSLFLPVDGVLTYGSMRNLTALTDRCRERIVDGDGSVMGENGEVGWVGSGEGGQEVLGRGDGRDREEIEDTIAAALQIICSDLLIELERPESNENPETPKCQTVIKEYHEFLGATVKFLHVVQERQMLWRWDGESSVFEGVGWLQGLWASRETNKQHRSFIEQQMQLYDYKGSKSCFGKSEEVLERDVEVVEYMNDLIDLFS